MRLGLSAAAALLAIMPGAPEAQTQRRPIELPASESYTHKPTGLAIPLTLDDLPRVGGTALEADQLDEYVNFESGNEAVTVYVFRNVAGSVPVWFDRSTWAVEHRPDVYGAVTPLDRSPAFIPPGQANPSALTRIWLTGKGPFRSTGLAFVPLGEDWYVKIRYSSATHSAEALAPRIAGVVAALGWPTEIAEQPDAALIADCAEPLAFTGTAKPLKPDGAETLMSSFLTAAINDPSIKKKESAAPPAIWCRDPAIAADGTRGIYRADGAADAYLIALGDAGRAISVGRNELGELVAKKKKPRFSVSLLSMGNSYFFTPHDRLPDPAQALKIVQSGRVTSSVSTWGKSNITLDSGTFK